MDHGAILLLDAAANGGMAVLFARLARRLFDVGPARNGQSINPMFGALSVGISLQALMMMIADGADIARLAFA